VPESGREEMEPCSKQPDQPIPLSSVPDQSPAVSVMVEEKVDLYELFKSLTDSQLEIIARRILKFDEP
jgi:hypothetical protein